ncbi:ABC transporter permease [Aliikangiella sp. G2MR2-5]|uniref:ABC transporter permease n=1 Tax=Aliikangiella sp. G2MR2-5 TaxID=2788943 RepID=UPI0018AB26EA|nr:ABC transporter permease [Aliikangiella sp. G2MR2-5]
MWIALLKSELLKTKRSLSFLMMIACPFAVVSLQALLMLNKDGGAMIEKSGWKMLWMMGDSLWCYFMLPLYVALVSALLNGNEHKNQTWRVMMTLPIKQYQLYLTKALLAWFYIVGANIFLFVWTAILILLFMLLGVTNPAENFSSAFDYPIIKQLSKSAISCLPILFFQHALSWRVQNIVAPLAVGVIATMGILKIGQSEHWIYYPWSYITMANMGGDPDAQTTALILSLSVSGILLFVSTLWLSRKEVYS